MRMVAINAMFKFAFLLIMVEMAVFMTGCFVLYVLLSLLVFFMELCEGFKQLHWTTQWSAVIALALMC